MRLDKFLSSEGILSRTETSKSLKAGRIVVNDAIVKQSNMAINPESDVIKVDGKIINYQPFVYFLLNKPDGYVSATEDGNDPTVVSMFPERYQKKGIFPCGRLDKHTLGLMLITNDGILSHKLLAPNSHVEKKYRYVVKFPLSQKDVETLENGVDIGGYITKPCKLYPTDERNGIIAITEGKYHQIKLMMEAVHNQIRELERVSFGPLELTEDLKRGEWREVTAEELEKLKKHS